MRDGDEEVPVCPACDVTSVSHKSGTPLGRRTHPEDWYCRQCGVHFDDPVYRPRELETNPAGNSPLVRALMDADPGDVGGDHGGE